LLPATVVARLRGALGERFDGASALERDGLLKSQGQYRAKVYHLPGAAPVSPEQVFAAGVSSVLEGSSSVHNEISSVPNVSSPGPSGAEAGMEDGAASADTGSRRDAMGCLLSPHLDAPIVDNLAALSSVLRQELELRAALPRRRGRLNPDELVIYLMAIDNAKFRKPVVPGDRLTLTAEVVKTKGAIWKQRGVATVDGAVVCEADFLATAVKKTGATS
jgi:acyl dehydratase